MINLYRKYSENQTDGVMVLPGGTYIRTLELPDKNNQVNISCIPEGQYVISRDHTGKYQYFKVNDVEGRTDIEMHLATKTSHLLGCIGFYKKSDLEKLIELFGESDWALNIVEDEASYNDYMAASE